MSIGLQKTKLYDMYARFFRWASDRVDENGIVAFVTNRSFIESRTFDGFRKIVAKEFNNIYVVDLGGDVRADPRLSGTKHNVFGIQTGVAISFMVKRAKAKVCRIHYACCPQLETAEEKLAFLDATQFNKIEFEEVSASANGDWVNQGEAEFRDLVPIADKDTKFGSLGSQDRAIFKLYGNGVNTARDEWVMSWSKTSLQRIAAHLVGAFKKTKVKDIELDQSLKWSRNLKRRFLSGSREEFDAKYIRPTLYRPFVKKFLYDSKIFIDERGPVDEVFVSEVPENKAICVIAGDRQPFSVLASSCVPNFNLYSADSTKYVPRYRFVENTRVDNITDWALKHFCAHYNTPNEQERQINKDAIFNYVYGVLHDPVYREKYALNLKREFPHIPSYIDFWWWADRGEELMGLHVGYEAVDPFALGRIDVPAKKLILGDRGSQGLLRSEPERGVIHVDTETQLTGVPSETWRYRLGNRSAIEWILDVQGKDP